eukprot:m.237936 g.237936  ORF g.237936 m.237936 type:complete len:408 (+) comp13221_c0_seq1:38-1261(+)
MGAMNTKTETEAEIGPDGSLIVSTALYRFHGGAPPYRGMFYSKTVSVSVPKDATVGDALAAIQREHGEGDRPTFFFVSKQQSLPKRASDDFPCERIGGGRQGSDATSLRTLDSRALAPLIAGKRIMVYYHWPPGQLDIGVFARGEESLIIRNASATGSPAARLVRADEAPGAELLSSAALPTSFSCADVANIVEAFGISNGHHEIEEHTTQLLSPAVCARLIALVDAAWENARVCHGAPESSTDTTASIGQDSSASCNRSLTDSVRAGSREDDFKLVMDADALRDVIGEHALQAIGSALLHCNERASGITPRNPDAIAVRRTTGTGRWIGFHTDRAGRTVQVPLGDSNCVGGKLVFARGDGTLHPVARRAGTMLAHDGDAVHGVTRLDTGVRYGLFALRARASEAAV